MGMEMEMEESQRFWAGQGRDEKEMSKPSRLERLDRTAERLRIQGQGQGKKN